MLTWNAQVITCKSAVHLERADVVSWNTPRTQNRSLEALMRAPTDRARAVLSLNESVQAMPGIRAGRQAGTNTWRQRETNQSAHGAVPDRNLSAHKQEPDIQAKTNESVHPEQRERETNESVHPESRARHPGWETTGDT